MNQQISLKFIIQNNKFKLVESIYDLKDLNIKNLDGDTTIFKIGNLMRGFSEILYSQENVTVLTDEFSSFPLFYHYSSKTLYISNNIELLQKKIDCELEYNELDINNFIKNGHFFNSTGFYNIHITPNNSKTNFSVKNDDLTISKTFTKNESVINENNNFHQLYDDLVQSTDFLLKSDNFETVDLTGGVDTRLILGILFELGYEKKYTFVTDKTGDNDRKFDFEIANQICAKFELKHQEKNKNYLKQFDQTKCLSGKYGSEFFSGEFQNFWGEYQMQDRRFHYPNLPYLENHISPLSDLYYIYGTRSFSDAISNLYNINNTPFKMRNSILSLNKISLSIQKSYGFHNFVFENKLRWLAEFPFFSNFSNFNNTFNFIKKNISPKDPNTYQVCNSYFLQILKENSFNTVNDSSLKLFDKKIRLSRIKILDEYYKTHINHYSK